MSHQSRESYAASASLPRTARGRGAGRARHGAPRGFTLLEVVIALAIFVIGAVAIVRIFVPALGVIQNAGNQTIAMRSAQSLLARTSSAQFAAPDWIYEGDGVTDVLEVFTGTVNKNGALPRTPALYSDSALNKYKIIEGERQKVLTNTAAATGEQNFVLTNFAYRGNVRIKKEDWIEGVTIDNEGKLSFANATLASDGSRYVASDGISPLNTGSSAYVYYISYNWVDGDSYIHGVTGEAYVFPQLYAVGSQYLQVLQGRRRNPSSTGETPRDIVPGPVRVRLVHDLGLAKVLETGDNFRGIATGSVNAGEGLNHPSVSPGDTVYLSYEVYDWRWLVDDSVPSFALNAADTQELTLASTEIKGVSLPLTGLGRGDIDTGGADQWLYTALMPQPASYQIDSLVKASWKGTGSGNNNIQVHDKTGRVAFQYDSALSRRPKTRTVYATEDGWAQQISVAPVSYVPYIANGDYLNVMPGDSAGRPANAPVQPWRNYYWSPSNWRQIVFRNSEAGKTVFITYYVQPTSGAPIRKAQMFTIDDDVIPAPIANFSAVGEVSEIRFDEAYPVVSIVSVQGLSVQARTAWIEDGRYNQRVATGYRQ